VSAFGIICYGGSLPSSNKAALENIPTVTRLSLVARAVATEADVSPQMASNLSVLEIVEQTSITIATVFVGNVSWRRLYLRHRKTYHIYSYEKRSCGTFSVPEGQCSDKKQSCEKMRLLPR